MNRRSLLALASGAVAGGVASCPGAADPRDPADSRPDTAPSGGANASADGDPPTPDDRDVPHGANTHDLYVVNFDEVVHDVTLAVVRSSDDALIWRAASEAPARCGFSIPDLLADGPTYETTLEVADGPTASDTRQIEACPNQHGGSKNLGV